MPPKKTKSESMVAKKKSIKKEKETDNVCITDAFERVKKPVSKRGKKSTNTETSKIQATTTTTKAITSMVDIPTIQMILKSFDLNCDYGPIIGISRTDRLKRAEYFNLTVSEDVKMILEDQKLLDEYPELNTNIWHDIETIL